MTDTGFQDAAVLLNEVAEGSELEGLVSAGASKANEFRQNLRSFRGSLLREPPVITPEEARGRLDQLISSATGTFAPLATKLRAARSAL